MRLTQIIEALLFASDAPLSAADLARVDERLDEDTVQAVIEELRAEYDAAERSFSIYEVAGGYQLLTRPEFIAVLERYETVPQPARLSAPSLEVLAIIAYRQPIGRVEVEEIRGVSSTGPLKTLQDRHLVEAVGRAEGLGRPLLYGTTSKFLEHFGFRSLEDLPRPDELPVVLRSRVLDGSAPAEAPAEATAPADAEAAAGAAPVNPDGAAAASGTAGEESGEQLEAQESDAPVVTADASPAASEPAADVDRSGPTPAPLNVPASEAQLDDEAIKIADEASGADADALVELQELADDRDSEIELDEPVELADDHDLSSLDVEVMVIADAEADAEAEGEPLEREP